jgi:hypothetical protein
MQQRKSDTGIAAKLQLVFSSQEEARDLPRTVPHGRARDEDAELSSLEALIQEVLNSTRDELNAVESLDCVLS